MDWLWKTDTENDGPSAFDFDAVWYEKNVKNTKDMKIISRKRRLQQMQNAIIK